MFNILKILFMGTIKKGILGGFSGKVGTVVGASWKGIDYIRSLPTTVRNPRTKGQVSQRTKFSVTMDFLKPLTPVIRQGFSADASGKITAMNAAMSYNLMNAITGEFPDLVIDYERAVIARGSLYGAESAAATAAAGEVDFDWDLTTSSNSGVNDSVVLVAYIADKKDCVYNDSLGKRMEGYGSLAVPAIWAGDTVHTYIFFISEDGKRNSNSIYTGSVEVVLA